MQNRKEVVAEYFYLRLLLNRSNIHRNEKTQVVFRIHKNSAEEDIFSATLLGTDKASSIELCRKKDLRFQWAPSYFSGLINLEKYCADYLKTNLGNQTNVETIKRTMRALSEDLSTLGIHEK